jgi:hypothetical protein
VSCTRKYCNRCRIGFVFTIIPLLVLIPSAIQSEPHRTPKQQTDFDMEMPLERPVVLPSGALRALRTSNLSAGMLRDCAENEGVDVNQIPASWFVSSWIDLSGARSSGLVVRAEHGCFWGAHITQFWLVSKAGAHYRVVFTGKADAFRVLATRTSGYRDVQLIFAMQAGAEINYVTFKYTDGEYRESDNRTEHPYNK